MTNKKITLNMEEKTSFQIAIDGIFIIVFVICLILCMANLTEWGLWVFIPVMIDVIIDQIIKMYNRIKFPLTTEEEEAPIAFGDD